MVETTRPLPATKEDRERWEHGEVRLRLLEGRWDPDLRTELALFFHEDVLASMPAPDLSRNGFKSIQEQINVLYDEDPLVTVEGVEEMPEVITPYLWPVRQDAQLKTLGMNEAYLRLDYREGRGIAYRAVPHSHVGTTIADPLYPDRPVYLEELVPRYPEPGKCVWTWEVWDVRDAAHPEFRVELPETTPGEGRKLYEPVGEYPYFDAAGAPILPYVLVHKTIGNRLYCDRRGVEAVAATLRVACLLSMWVGGVRDCAAPMHVAINMQEPVGITKRDGGPNLVPKSQNAVQFWRSAGDKPASITTLAATMDPRSMGDAIADYARGMAQEAGLSPADLQVTGTSGMSGYAIAISRDGLRKAAKRQIPAARMADQMILATAARLANSYMGTAYPEEPDAYSVSYAKIGKSQEEVKADLDQVALLMDKGLATEVDALLTLHPELDERQALAKVLDVIRTRKLLDALRAAPLDLLAQANPETLELPDRDVIEAEADDDETQDEPESTEDDGEEMNDA